MIRRVLVGVGIALGLAVVFFGRDAVSYVRTSLGYVNVAVQEMVPMEFQIQRARDMIEDLVPEIRKNMQLIAREDVEVERLAKQIAETEARLAKEKEGLVTLSADLAAGRERFVYAGRHYSAEQVRTDLARRFERYKTGEATLASLQEMRAARQRSVDAAREKLEGMLAARRQLQVEVESLEAQLKMLQAAQTASEYSFDDSKLARVKQLVADLQARLEVAARLVDAEGHFHDQIPLDDSAPADIVQQVTEYFAGSREVAEVAQTP